jgi:hypothetical protein
VLLTQTAAEYWPHAGDLEPVFERSFKLDFVACGCWMEAEGRGSFGRCHREPITSSAGIYWLISGACSTLAIRASGKARLLHARFGARCSSLFTPSRLSALA